MIKTRYLLNALSILIIIFGIGVFISSHTNNRPKQDYVWTVQNSVAKELANDLTDEIQLISIVIISLGIVMLGINNSKQILRYLKSRKLTQQ